VLNIARLNRKSSSILAKGILPASLFDLENLMAIGERKMKKFYFVLLVMVGLMIVVFLIAKFRDEIQAEVTSEIANEFVEYSSVNEKR
jgi:hypothetical protein